jgi:translation initiation factor IF-3
VVGEDGGNLGVLPTEEALRRAQEVGLDLVEVNPKGTPPVCKILDFGKYKYEEKKKQREAKKKQTTVEIKEIKLRPKTDDHDLNVKVRASRRFLESGNKVKVVCRFRGREITHPERAQMQLDFFVQKLEEVANVEQRPMMEGRTMALLLAPKPQVLQRLATDRHRSSRDDEDLGATPALRAESAAADSDG